MMKQGLFTKSLISISLGMFIASCASADYEYGHRRHHHNDVYVYETRTDYGYERTTDYGRVLDARPIYRQVAVQTPDRSCRVETVAHETRRGGDSFAGTVVGGLVGAAIGHELGNGRGAATAAGGLIGATIGNDAGGGNSRSVRYRDEEVCSTYYHTEYENRLIGYDVSYSYQGRIYQTRTDRHPGDRIAVDVNVRPSYRD